MGKGFDTFMQNPYYREMYENAPTDYLRAVFKHSWDNSPFVTGGDPNKIPPMKGTRPYTREELEYRMKYATQGRERAYYAKKLAELAK